MSAESMEFTFKGVVFELESIIVMTREVDSMERDDSKGSLVQFVKQLNGRGIKTGVVSRTGNADLVIKPSGLSELCEVVVDGLVSAAVDQDGPPADNIFVVAADRLGLKVNECVVVAASAAGIQAGRRGNFALVLGVAGEGESEQLYATGADIVVDDRHDIDIQRIEEWFSRGVYESSWRLDYYGFAPEEERLREALTTVGNGYMGTRGAYVGTGIDGDVHYPGTYLAGLFNTAGTEVAGRTVYNNDFVNAPNWLRAEISVGTGGPLRPGSNAVISLHHWTDFRDAVTHHDLVLEDNAGRRTRIETQRFVSMARPHLAALRVTVTPVNHSEPITIESFLDGDVVNYGVERYRKLEGRHLEEGTTTAEGNTIRIESRTTKSKVTVSMEAHHTVRYDTTAEAGGTAEGPPAEETHAEATPVVRTLVTGTSRIGERFLLEGKEGRPVCLDKLVWVATDRDWPIEKDPMPELGSLLFDQLRGEHAGRWRTLWERADLRIAGDRFAQRTIRLHIYHLLTTASPDHYPHMDIGLPARGIHGEAYRGHIFWDELFIAPFFTRTFPEITRAHLMYRYRRLDAARRIARDEGHDGALYPWQSADSGGRESQQLHYNPVSGDWDPDLSKLQRHISIAIAHNIWEYHYSSGDHEFMDHYGMEMLLEIARFWAGIAEYDEGDGRYHIDHVMGPDEFHEKYPDAAATPEEGGFRDNAYNNIMVAWLLDRVGTEYQNMPEERREEMAGRVGLTTEELDRWKEISQKLAVVIDDDGIISQFEGFRSLKRIDWNAYREKYGDIRRMDRILKAEDDSPDNYQIAKQADVLMTWYLLTPEEVADVLGKMGYSGHDPIDLLERNYEFYLPRTSHGSTLSYIVHAAIIAQLPNRKREGWNWFLESMKSDIYDTQGGTTLEGIHCGVMAGTVTIIVDNFTGLIVEPSSIYVNPDIPEDWNTVAYKVRFREALFTVSAGHDRVRLGCDAGCPDPIEVHVNGTTRSLAAGKSVEVELAE